ncbi:hypothetical protein WMF30_01380 [Sorangium sp. So ce134]
MGTTKQDEKTNAHIAPGQHQLDPGLKDWRLYIFQWGDLTKLADVMATRTAGGAYAAGREYWFVVKAHLAFQSTLRIKGQDMEWGDPEPSDQGGVQEFTSPTSGTWQQLVGADLTTGTLYKHTTEDYHVRIAATVTSQTQAVTLLRWYRKSATQPSPSFDPRGTYTEVPSLGSGTIWYADSKSP